MERLAEIDRELDAFGKSAEQLAGVIARARALASSLEGDEALSALLAEASAAAASAADRTRAQIAAAAPVRAPITEHAPVPRAPRPARAPIEMPERDTAVMTAAAVEDVALGSDSAPLQSSDIAGLSVDELFADAEPSAPAASPTGGGLADLFDDEEMPVQLPAGDGSLADFFEDEASADPTTVGNLADLFGESEELRLSDPEIEAELSSPRPRTVPPPPPSQAPPPLLDPFSDEDDEETGHFNAAQMARIERGVTLDEPSDDGFEEADDDFELLVDEDVLELDSEPPSAPDEEPKKPGLFGRLLGKK